MPFANIKGEKYFYEMHHAQQSQTIVLVHGHPFDCTQWSYQIKALKNFKLIIPNLKGYGKTIETTADKIFIEDHAQELNLLLDELNIETAHFVGLSMGGQIIAEFARQYPHRTKSLMLCNTLPFAETALSKATRIEAGNTLLQFGMEYHVNNDIEKYIHPNTVKDNHIAFSHLKEMMLGTNAKNAAANHFGRAERRDNTAFIQQFNKPIHFVCGEADNFTPSNKMITFANTIAPNLYTIIPNTGHLTNMENPILFNKVLIQFYNTYFKA
jgi:pimeloyl-ACP methyl ester carboxylesterase